MKNENENVGRENKKNKRTVLMWGKKRDKGESDSNKDDRDKITINGKESENRWRK